jgi:hypothetical protein
MIKVLDLTVYELLGYLIPGGVTFFGLFLVLGAFEPTWLDRSHWDNLGWWVVLPLVLAYILGHVVQAIGNAVFGKRFEDPALNEVVADLPDSGFEAVARRLSVTASADEIAKWKSTHRRPFLALCTEILEQDGKPAMRDVFLYREGFYRGTCLALVMLALGLVVFGIAHRPDRWLHLEFFEERQQRKETVLALAAAVLSLGAAWSFKARYARFARYRISSCLWGAVTVTAAVKPATAAPAAAAKELD